MNTLLHWLTSPEWALVVKTLLHSLWQGAAIAVALALLLRRVASPEARYRIAVTGLGAVLLSAMITWGVLNVPKPAATPAAPMSEKLLTETPAPTGPVEKIVVAANWTRSKQHTQWTAWLALAWLLGASAMLGRASVKIAGAEQLRRSCQPLDDSRINELVAEARRAVKLTRQVRIAVTQQLTSPAVVGVLMPTLILPLSLLTTLTPEQIRFVLLHELAHIRRGDYLANLFQLFAEALLFFNPSVWWLSHQIRREREACCDALAIQLSGAPADYARTLVSVAETILIPPPAAAPAFGNEREPSSLSDRVQRALVPGYRPSLRLTWRAMLTALVVGGVLLGVMAVGTRNTVAAAATALAPKSNAFKTGFVREANPVVLDANGSKFEFIKASDGRLSWSLTWITNQSRETIAVSKDGFFKGPGWFVYIESASRLWTFNGERQLDMVRRREGSHPMGRYSVGQPGIYDSCPKAVWEALPELARKFWQDQRMQTVSTSLSSNKPPSSELVHVLSDGSYEWQGRRMELSELRDSFVAVVAVDSRLPVSKEWKPGHQKNEPMVVVRAADDAPFTSVAALMDMLHGLPASQRLDLPQALKQMAFEKLTNAAAAKLTTNSTTDAPADATVSLYTRTFKVDSNVLAKIVAANLKPGETADSTNSFNAVRRMFASAGVDIELPGKTVFYGDWKGTLFVRATLQDLDAVEKLIEKWQKPLPKVDESSLVARTFRVDPNSIFLSLDPAEVPSDKNPTVALQRVLAKFGVDLQPPKTLFLNDRTGVLFVRSTPADLDIIEKALQVLNSSPPQVNIRAKYVEMPASKETMMLGTLGLAGSNLLATARQGGKVMQSSNCILTGILSAPQADAVFKMFNRMDGVEMLSAPDVTTVSGRQAQLQVVDIRSIVTGVSSVVTNGVITNILQTAQLPTGPVLDVVPYVSADGFTVQMVVMPTVTEFMGYEKADPAVTKFAKSKSLEAELPLPIFRVRQATTTAVVWDGQTLVMGGIASAEKTITKTKVPVLGDLPVVGGMFRRERKGTEQRSLFIFVTPTIIDPEGNRVHSEDNMPYPRDAVPQQSPVK